MLCGYANKLAKTMIINLVMWDYWLNIKYLVIKIFKNGQKTEKNCLRLQISSNVRVYSVNYIKFMNAMCIVQCILLLTIVLFQKCPQKSKFFPKNDFKNLQKYARLPEEIWLETL